MKFECFRATDQRDGKKELFITRDGTEMACVANNTSLDFIRRLERMDLLQWYPLDWFANHVGNDREVLAVWERE